MSDIFVLADDLTGAAEIGGLAFRHGLSARIVFSLNEHPDFREQVIILDSNSRNLTPDQACKKISCLLSKSFLGRFSLIYKKVDSVLRGPVVSEIKVLTITSGKKTCCLVPANPSQKRTIRAGKYYIDDVPISKTAFKDDLFYPRFSDHVTELIADNAGEILTGSNPDGLFAGKILVPDIGSVDDIQSLLASLDVDDVLLAGGADFFNEVLNSVTSISRKRGSAPVRLPDHDHFIIGSNTWVSVQTKELLVKRHYQLFEMPQAALTDKACFDLWHQQIKSALECGRQVAVSGPIEQISDPSLAKTITVLLVEVASDVARLVPPDSWLFIEGGETASMFCRKLGWTSLNIHYVWPDEAVSLGNNESDLRIVVKPGSYMWPKELLADNIMQV